jgi:hypothetical protein
VSFSESVVEACHAGVDPVFPGVSSATDIHPATEVGLGVLTAGPVSSQIAAAQAVTIPRTNARGSSCAAGSSGTTAWTMPSSNRSNADDPLPLGQERCVVGVVVDDGARSLRWEGRQPGVLRGDDAAGGQ